MSSYLQTSIEYLKGVGPARAELLKKELQIFTFNDLLFHLPYRHVDRSKIYKVNELRAEMPYVQVKGIVSNLRLIGKNRAQRLVADLRDETGVMELVWFQGIKWVKESVIPGKIYLAFGKPAAFSGTINIAHPTLDDADEAATKKYLHIMPMYNATEKMKARGLDSRAIMKMMNLLLADPKLEIPENLPEPILVQNKLVQRHWALLQIHFPKDDKSLTAATFRLKFEEFFFIQLKLLRFKVRREQLHNGIELKTIGEYFNTFFKYNLPFELTNAQKRVLKEIRQDVKTGVQMNRLVQGDVGSGKTVVALMTMLMAIDNGYQSCMMAPTEILAGQHFETIVGMLRDMPVKVRLLRGSTLTKERKVILKELIEGEIHILIGTHALIEEVVQFKNLGLAIIDEQHRFGVEQRARLWKKNVKPPHVLVMTATPIPRTLAMTLYGDLDTSLIDELPAGRKPIQTILRYDTHRLSVNGLMKQEIKKGRQIYIVYPLIAESEKLDYKNLVDGYEQMCRDFPEPEYQVCILHGKMKADEKAREMTRFMKGQAQIMVATTVIEVGVNVPNATVMIIESAQKFGLSQLHQLRGRVGRGGDQSYCVLMADVKLSNDAKQRLNTMVETNDGFKIAEADLKLRGPGDLEGTVQSGILDLRIGDLSKDAPIVALARLNAQDILHQDPNLQHPNHLALSQYFEAYQRTAKWGRIS